MVDRLGSPHSRSMYMSLSKLTLVEAVIVTPLVGFVACSMDDDVATTSSYS